ncbi:hypothetical protein Poli38472_004418 [Pythium oligandrum]|uniref:Xaa-Pro dipeptidyl-peptidase C-terminal domain-containing protein n=1 Tax=Pythium oligandrum TaxID=41045 RepID=A0A8K1C9S7_PYTOL|nr:hypothetical protein Poli38472_004418 [Pythium oligandrum]|eukprot:TMW59349.1 hypothetical protein Poli38472_004418 [Pythium oligandrum]
MAGDAAPAAAAAPAKTSNAGAYMKSAFFSMISVTIATSAAKFLSGQEDYIVCSANVNDNSWLPSRYFSVRYFNPQETHHESQYVAMSDGVELAVDTYLANYLWEKQQPVPTIVYYTRHGRGYTVDFPFNLFNSYTSPRTTAYTDRFIAGGYAWVAVDVRGTGASGGSKKHDFSDEEVQDGYELIEWITKQPWSNGKVGAVGHGFEGTGALLLAASGHPALKAVSLNGAAADVFNSAFFPSGVKNIKALKDFGSFTYDLDRQIRWREIPTFKGRLMMKHFGGNVYPVNKDTAKLNQLVADHFKNPNITEELEDVHFRDDVLKTVGVPVSQLDATRFLAKIAASGVAVHSFGGYYDMAVARSSILLHQYLTNTLDADTASLLPELPEGAVREPGHHRLTLGPWSHAGVDNTDPFAQSKQKCFWHLDEISRFMDHHIYEKRRKITDLEEEEPIHYFTMVHNRWKTTDTWPPAHLGEQTFFLGLNKTLEEVNAPEGEETLEVSPVSQFDAVTRWDMVNHMFGNRPFYYHDRAPMASEFVTFLTPEIPLTEITGEVELRLFFSVDKPAVNLVAYLEDSDYMPPFKNENKRPGVTYITEALLNPVHKTIRPDSSVHSFLKKDSREIVPGVVYEAVLKFQPVSYVVKHKHQLRLSIGVATSKDFAPAGPEQATKLTVHFGGDYPSSLKIPSFAGLNFDSVVPKEGAPAGLESEPVKPVEEVSEEDEFAEETEEVAKPTEKEEL